MIITISSIVVSLSLLSSSSPLLLSPLSLLLLFNWLDCFSLLVLIGFGSWWNWATIYTDVIMTTVASQITSLTVVYSTVYSDADQRKHQSSSSLAFVWGIHRDRWIPRTKGQLRGKCFHSMTSPWIISTTPRYFFNSLTPGRCGGNLKHVISQHMFLWNGALRWMSRNTFDDKSKLV